MSNIIYVVKIEIDENIIKEIIDVINGKEIKEESKKLSLKEVINNEKLLKYLCEDYIENERNEVLDVWNNDGFLDFKDYR